MNYDSNFLQSQVKRSYLRKIIRKFYFKNILQFVTGPTIDFGCGAGELLKRLPHGSVGLEINPEAVRYCQDNGLNVTLYNPDIDNYNFSGLENNKYHTFVSSHVFEHLDDPKAVFKKIKHSCQILGIERMIIIVPAFKGFYCDKLAGHKTYIDKEFFTSDNEYTVKSKKYFPLNSALFGKYFKNTELVVVLERS